MGKSGIRTTGFLIVLGCLMLISFQNCGQVDQGDFQPIGGTETSTSTPVSQNENNSTIFLRNLNYSFFDQANGATSTRKVVGSLRLYRSGAITITGNLYDNNTALPAGTLREFSLTLRVRGKITTSRFIASQEKPWGSEGSNYPWHKFLDTDASCLASGTNTIPLNVSVFDTNTLPSFSVDLRCYTASSTLNIDLSKAFENIEESAFSFRIADGSRILWAGASSISGGLNFTWQK